MAITTGNLLTDPAAQSFISIADADAYLAPEQRFAWDIAENTAREAALVQASRWLAGAMQWQPVMLTPGADLAQVGKVAARLAVEALSVDLYAATDTTKQVQSMSAGSVSITYRAGARADAAGRAWPWLMPMLAGLIVNSGALRKVIRA